VLSLTCALMATLLQRWARTQAGRYFQMIQRHNATHVRAHIRECLRKGRATLHSSHLCAPVLRKARCLCIPRPCVFHPRNRNAMLPLLHCSHSDAPHLPRLSLPEASDGPSLVLRSNNIILPLLCCPSWSKVIAQTEKTAWCSY